jgi:phosphorylcholine metabolism protein LicD
LLEGSEEKFGKAVYKIYCSGLMNVIIFSFLTIIVLIIIYWLTKPHILEGFMNTGQSEKQDAYRYVLMQTQKVLDELKIPFFLSSGTCLGYVRERDFMEHDYDIDIGINYSDYKPSLIDAMRKEGLILYRIYGSMKTGIELSFYMFSQRAKIDIFIHKDTDDKSCWYSYSMDKKRKIKYCVSKFNLKEIDFLGLKVNIPDPVKKYLEEHYGKDWRIPKSSGELGDYNYSISPISIVN